MTLALHLTLFLVTFVGMEWVAYLTHKYVMHGWLWSLHESHHRPRTGVFEKNDFFAAFFSVVSIVLIYIGTHGYPSALSVGLGMTAYGIAYFLFHDVIVHRRIRIPYKPRSGYMKRIYRAHWIHHSTHGRDGAISFGFLYSPPLERLQRSTVSR
jgi:beta-carotene 3-hydroxylase